MLVKVTGTSFIRDTNSMLLSNTDTVAREEYYNKVRMLSRQKEELNMMKADISDVRSELGDIKQMLQQLLSKQ
jgi:BMFP domain-containing protein YqiC